MQKYTLEHLNSHIEVDVGVFYNRPQTTDLKEGEAELDFIEEIVQQCRIALKNENSRRLLKEQIERMTNKNIEETMRKHTFKLKRRGERLRKAAPYTVQTASLEEGTD